MGVTTLGSGVRPFSRVFQRGTASVAVEDGAVSSDGRVFGPYLHGLFENGLFVDTYPDSIRREKGMPLRRGKAKQTLQDQFDRLAEQFEKHLVLPRLLAICGLGSDGN